MDLIIESGIDVADAVCPHPMTKVTLAEYYRRWGERITIFGGIPSNLPIVKAPDDDTFETYMDEFFCHEKSDDRRIFLHTNK